MGSSTGFTVLELLVVMAIMGIMAALAIPNLSSTRDQMDVSDAKHQIAFTLAEVRAEAIRLKAQVRVTFTSSGLSWDIFQDGTTDGTLRFPSGVSWSGSTPAPISFDGLGLIRGLAATQTMTVKRGKKNTTININRNGYIA